MNIKNQFLLNIKNLILHQKIRMSKTKSLIFAHSPKKQMKQTTKEFRMFFLLEFTKELIKHSGKAEIFELENVLKEENKEKEYEKKKLIHTIRKSFIQEERDWQIKNKLKQLKPLPKPITVKRNILIKPQYKQIRVLRIPEPKLPQRLQYLRPTPTNRQIDLNKLNPLIKDPIVKSIECNGPDENIIVKGTMGIKKTKIILSKEEINQIIEKFSESTKIPIQEGVFKVVFGKLILTAIISEVIGSKFIIRKIMYNPNPILRR